MSQGRWMAARRRRWGAAAAIAIGLAATILSAGTARAQAGEQIDSYAVEIAIEPAGTILVRETIEYDFGSAERHGILRDIPVRFEFDETYDRVYPLEVLSVRGSPGTPVGYEIEREGPQLRIRVGDPDRTISGRHLYEILYRVEGALNGFRQHDELYWNAVGTQWPVPIRHASVRVLAPAGIERVTCYAGPELSTQPCDDSGVRGGEGRYQQGTLGPYEGLTVVAAIPKGAVTEPRPILEERWSFARAFSVDRTTVASALGVLALVVAGLGRLLWTAGRDRRYLGSAVDVLHGSPTGEEQTVPLMDRTTLVPEFAPPEDLRPGQVGTLLDEVANPLDVTATIVDLAVRGYLTIEEIEKRWLFGKPDWRLTRTKEADGDLLEYERRLLDGLFEDGNEVLLSSLKTKFVQRLRRVQEALYQDVVARGWFGARPDKVRRRWSVIGTVALVAGVGLVVLGARFTHLGLVPVPLALGGIVLLGGARWMPRRTAKGTATVRRLHGFRMVIETSEVEFARFAEEENLFSRYLPYAVVFGAVEQWARRFEGLARAPDTSWYVSGRPFALAEFSGAMEGFSTTTAGTIASTPSSSGSSGFGGGSSGGGGGGGGGGSW